MGFQKGHSKLGGRKRGIPNRIKGDVRALLDELGCNPVAEMARIAMDDGIDMRIRARLLAKLARLVHPQLKAIEHSGIVGTPKDRPVDSARERILRALSKTSSPEPASEGPVAAEAA